MKKANKNLYLPGTNKNVGYILGNTMHIYKRYIKYFPVNIRHNLRGFGIGIGKQFIVDEDLKKNLELVRCNGWYYEIDEKLYTFFDCEFKTPDNLDLVEMASFYKNFRQKKKYVTHKNSYNY